MLPVVTGAFISACRQIYGTCEGLQLLIPYSLHESIAKAWKKVSSFKIFLFLPANLYLKYSHNYSVCHTAVKIFY